MSRRETEASDFLSGELNGLIKFDQLKRNTIVNIQPVGEREFKIASAEGKLEYEKFMEEPIVIKIHETTDEREPTLAYVGDNGVGVWIPRGKPVELPRKFVETLARSQVRAYRQERDPNPNADEGMITRRSGGASYAFAVLRDPSPKGRAWLARVTHESA